MTDYGHALAIVRQLERRAASMRSAGGAAYVKQAARDEAAAKAKAAEIVAADWRCRKCGAISDTAKVTACEHNFTGDYDMVNPTTGEKTDD